MFQSWFSIFRDAAHLTFEAQNVVTLRLMRLAAGGVNGRTEALRMVNEKIAAFSDAQLAATGALISGSTGDLVAKEVLGIYKKRVHANRCRLLRH